MTTQQHNDQPDNKTFYLQEALRLSELTLTEQDKAFDKMEQKAISLVTLCIAIIAYLLSWMYESINQFTVAASLLIIAVLMGAAWAGANVLYIRPFKVPGTTPKFLMQEYLGYNFHSMAGYLVDEYEKRINGNNNTLKEKSDCLELSLWWWKVGVFLACIWALWVVGYKLYGLDSP